MYEFKYGVVPDSEEDARYCQVKGDGGLYSVESINHENQTVVLSGGARTGDIKPIKNIRFISAERYQEFETLNKALTKKSVEEIIMGAEIKSLPLAKRHELRVVIHYALIDVGLGKMKVDNTHYLVLTNQSNELLVKVLVEAALPRLESLLTNVTESDKPESQMYALACGLTLGEQREFYDPLWSAKAIKVVITDATSETIKYKTLTAKGQVGKTEKQVSRHHCCLFK